MACWRAFLELLIHFDCLDPQAVFRIVVSFLFEKTVTRGGAKGGVGSVTPPHGLKIMHLLGRFEIFGCPLGR